MVTVFTQPECRPCKRVIDKLSEADISEDLLAKEYVTRFLQAKSTPIIEAPGFDAVIGYQPDKLKEIIDAFRN
jgi:arsenate reductase-like glutaredoxin family protein